jgi:hypothetical protein
VLRRQLLRFVVEVLQLVVVVFAAFVQRRDTLLVGLLLDLVFLVCERDVTRELLRRRRVAQNSNGRWPLPAPPLCRVRPS